MTSFDTIHNRLGSGSMKWDEDPGALPLWVADMDFRTAPCVIEALTRRVNHGIFGYTMVRPQFYESLIDWFRAHHGWTIRRDHILYTSGVVPAISAIIKALVAPGEGVIVQTPVYNCFFSSIRNNGCRIVENQLVRTDIDESMFTYSMNLEQLETLAADKRNKMLLLCNPHNPAGRIWSCDELTAVSAICRRHGLIVVSDEIHCDLAMPGFAYTPFQTIHPEAISCVSPSKAFNTAGLQIAAIVCPDQTQRALIDRAININEVCDVNPFGVEALIAAYSPRGKEWLDQLRDYLYGNYLLVKERLTSAPLGLAITRLEATYLPWIDISSLNLTADTVTELLRSRAGVKVSSGTIYGSDGYIRLNIACPRPTLSLALDRISNCLTSL